MSDHAIERLEALDRRVLASLPTPLLPAPRLAAELGRDRGDLWIKMDAETGFALGGNKVRKLEYELAPSRTLGVTRILTAGGPQSNHCRVTAAAAARLGVECTLVLNAPEPRQPTGNALLHRLFGARIVTVEQRDQRAPTLEALTLEAAAAGETPLLVPIGASTGLGCMGYVRAALELLDQLDALGSRPDRTTLFVPSSSCGTLAGLLLGLSIAGRSDVQLVGVSADATAAELREATLRIAGDGADILEWTGTLHASELVCVDDQVGAGYGVPTEASTAAIELFGHSEGLVLDPTYTGKGAAGLVSWVREARCAPSDRIVFLHTGGHPGLLA